MRTLLLLASAIALLMDSSAIAVESTKSVEVPLKSIWANCAEGAKALTELEPELRVSLDTPEEIAKYSTPEAQKALYERGRQSFVWKIEAAQLRDQSESKAPRTGFAVAGVGRAALPGVYAAIVEGKERQDTFSEQDEITVVFFTRPSVAGVIIDRIEWQGNILRIHFTMVSQGELAARSSLALIPVGKLAAGKYRVETVRSSRTDRDQRGFPPVKAGAENEIVCRPFNFVVASRVE